MEFMDVADRRTPLCSANQLLNSPHPLITLKAAARTVPNCYRKRDQIPSGFVQVAFAFWTKPPKVVWNLLLQAGSEGPTLIS
jgi:hypothetical protein